MDFKKALNILELVGYKKYLKNKIITRKAYLGSG